jgi:glycogen operon protein
MTNHDGFTLLDLVSYDQKHNLDNGEQNRDGTDYNVSWNCGEEGPTKKRKIAELRMRQRKNAYAMLLFAQGTPMLLAGDESGNSQSGNNNPYCHDSELSWTDWSAARKNKELTEFVQNAIAYRKSHRVLHQSSELKLSDYRSVGFPDLSFHGERAWYGDFEPMNRHLGCLYAGSYAGEEGFVYIGYNFSREEQKFALPILPKGQSWVKVMDTSLKESFLGDRAEVQPENARFFTAKARSVVILEGKEHESIETE